MIDLLGSLWLVPLYPLVAFVLIMLGRSIPRPILEEGDKAPLLNCAKVPMILTVGATALGLVHALAAVGWLLAQPGSAVHAVEQNWTWLQAGGLTLSLGTLLDAPSVMMLFVVTFVSLLIQIYSYGYMSHDKGRAKFFAYLALFNFSMLGLVLATNLFQMYVFWELVGVSSFLLIGFWNHKPAAAAASLKAFLVNRVGDFGFLIGILTLLFASVAWWPTYLSAHPEQAMLSFQGLSELAPFIADNSGVLLLTTIAILLFFGPMAKSAQVPLHTWLPDAMEGPTPISALIHAATMVAAGVFLIGRIYPLLQAAPDAQFLVAVIGTVTAVIGATIALVQTDIKKALAYSTMSQLGFMVAAMGLGAYTAGLFHLFTHAFFKAMLFLCSGSVIHACEDNQDMRLMGGLMKKLPITGLTYLIGTIAISGLFWTSGFWSKDEILLGAQQSNPVIYWTLVVTAGLTAFYMFRTFFMTFMGSYRGEADVHKEILVMVAPLVILAVPSALIGLLLSGVIPDLPAFSAYLAAPSVAHESAHHGAHHVAYFSEVGNQSQLIGMLGLLLAGAMYALQIINPGWIAKAFAPLTALFANKWFFDDIYEGLVEGAYLLFAEASAAFDRIFIDGAVNGTAKLVSNTGGALREIHNGRVQTYIAGLFLSILLLSILFLNLTG